VLSGKTQAINHLARSAVGSMIDYQMMKAGSSAALPLMHADKRRSSDPRYCVAGGTDIALHRRSGDAAADAIAIAGSGGLDRAVPHRRPRRLTGDAITACRREVGLGAEARHAAADTQRGESMPAQRSPDRRAGDVRTPATQYRGS